MAHSANRINVVPEKWSTTDRLKGKVILVTGATSGLGHATSVRAALEGADVVLCGRRIDRGEEVVAQIRELTGKEALFVEGDMTNETDVKVVVNSAVQRFGRIDGAFINAGRSGDGTPIHQTTLKEWNAIHQTNGASAFLTAKAVMEVMKKQEPKGGNIVICSSVLAFLAAGRTAAYMSSKASNLAMARAVAAEGGKSGIRCNAICPGAIETEIWAMGQPDKVDAKQMAAAVGGRMTQVSLLKRVGKPWEIAQPVCFLLSDESAFMTGSHLIVDGGQSAL